MVGGMGLGFFAQAGLVIAAAGFLAVLVSVFLRGNREAFDRARRMPLEDDGGAP